MRLLQLLLFLIPLSIFAQREVKPFSTLIIGNSGSIWYEDRNYDPNTTPVDYWEYHWTTNLAADLNKWFRAGIQHIAIYNNQDNGDPFHLYGGFVQVDFIPNYDNRLFMELNYHRGDFCDCDELFPYSKKGLNFYGLAGGFAWPVSRRITLETGLMVSYGRTETITWSGYGEIFFGVDFYLFAPKPETKPSGRNVKHL